MYQRQQQEAVDQVEVVQEEAARVEVAQVEAALAVGMITLLLVQRSSLDIVDH